MTTTYTWTGTFTAPVDHLFAILTDRGFLEARHRAQGAVSAEVVEVERTDRLLVQRVELVEYARTISGFDRRRTVPASITYEWELGHRRGRWVYRGPQGERVQVSGTLQADPEGSGSRLAFVFNMNVAVPLVGVAIENRAAREVEKQSPAFEALINSFLRRAALRKGASAAVR